jgi:hypothetical protein
MVIVYAGYQPALARCGMLKVHSNRIPISKLKGRLEKVGMVTGFIELVRAKIIN